MRTPIASGHAEVQRADSAHIPHTASRFDAALAVHVLYFWRDAVEDLAEIRRVLRPDAALVFGYRPDDAAQ